MKEIQGPYVAWYQAPMARVLVEITSAPKWRVREPYRFHWKSPQWSVEIREMVEHGTVCSGQPEMLTKHLHPLNDDTRELLALREDGPPSPVVVPEVPEIVFPTVEDMREAVEGLRKMNERLDTCIANKTAFTHKDAAP